MIWWVVGESETRTVKNSLGFLTPSFNLKRGVLQGETLLPFLFIIVLELLAIPVCNNNQISGIVVDANELKLVIFADDMTSFVCDSHTSPYSTLLSF